MILNVAIDGASFYDIKYTFIISSLDLCWRHTNMNVKWLNECLLGLTGSFTFIERLRRVDSFVFISLHSTKHQLHRRAFRAGYIGVFPEGRKWS